MRMFVSDFTEDWRAAYARLNPGKRRRVYAKHNGKEVHTFYASHYDEEIDGHLNPVRVSSREFKDRGGNYMNLARCYQFPLLVMVGRVPRLLLEPHRDALEQIFEVLGLDEDSFQSLIFEGELGSVLGGDPKKIKRRAKRRIKALEEEFAEKTAASDEKAAAAEAKERLAIQELAKAKGRIGQLQDDIRLKSVTPKSAAPVPDHIVALPQEPGERRRPQPPSAEPKPKLLPSSPLPATTSPPIGRTTSLGRTKTVTVEVKKKRTLPYPD